MKYFSEILNKQFDSEYDCLKAEEEYKEKQLQNPSKRKKELAKIIEEKTKLVEEANKLYEDAKNQAKEILEESNKKVEDILSKAEAKVKQAEREKVEALISFNKEFGAYTTTITNDKAAEELKKSLSRFDKNFIDLLSLFNLQ